MHVYIIIYATVNFRLYFINLKIYYTYIHTDMYIIHIGRLYVCKFCLDYHRSVSFQDKINLNFFFFDHA